MKIASFSDPHTSSKRRAACVHSCDFCVVPTAWGLKPYLKPVEDVVADIKQHWARKIIFIDLNLIADKQYAAQLFEALIPLKVQWFGLSTTLLGRDKPLLELGRAQRLHGPADGFLSRSPPRISNSPKKGFNSPLAVPRPGLRSCHQYGITLMACFTFRDG